MNPTMQLDEFVLISDCAKGFIARAGQIMLLESEGNYVKVTLEDGRSITTRNSLRKIIKTLDPKIFFQANRWAIVNFNYVESAKNDGKMINFFLRNGQLVILSRENSIELRRKFRFR